MFNAEINTFVFREATFKDKNQIFELYRKAIGTEGCTWSLDYPNEDILSNDIKNHNLFCMENDEHEVVGAISIDRDEIVDGLKCWNKAAGNMAELARLVVRDDCQNHGMAPELIKNVVKVLKERGYASAHYLVSRHHEKALASYRKLDFECVGESNVLDNEWYCYEKIICESPEKNYKILTIPNILSFLRLILAGLFLVLYSNTGSIRDNIWAITALILSGITDFLDGRIARKYNMISELGKILDPIADKITEVVIALCLVTKYEILIYLITLFVVKELFMSISGLMIIKKTGENNGAKWYGKVSTFSFYIIMIALLVIPNIPLKVANIMIIVCMLTMAFAFIMYAKLYYKIYTKKIAN